MLRNTAFTAALVIALGATDGYPAGCNAHIFPDGLFRADDGRPASLTNGALLDWQMDQAVADGLIAALAASGKPILYDYEHNSIYGDSQASGWIDRLVYVAGKGLFAHVEWTEDGAADIAKKKYRYSSPYFAFDPKTGRVTELISVALTNNAALGDLGAVALARRAALASLPVGALANQFLFAVENAGTTDGGCMTPEQMAALTAEQKSQLAALTAERDGLKTQLAALTSERDDLKTKVTAHENEKAAAALAAEKTKHTELLTAALTDGRIVPAQKEWAEKQSLAALTEYLDATKPLAMLGKQADGKNVGGDHGLTKDELAACARMGVTPEQFKSAKG